jgi:hypothetical protein
MGLKKWVENVFKTLFSWHKVGGSKETDANFLLSLLLSICFWFIGFVFLFPLCVLWIISLIIKAVSGSKKVTTKVKQ